MHLEKSPVNQGSSMIVNSGWLACEHTKNICSFSTLSLSLFIFFPISPITIYASPRFLCRLHCLYHLPWLHIRHFSILFFPPAKLFCYSTHSTRNSNPFPFLCFWKYFTDTWNTNQLIQIYAYTLLISMQLCTSSECPFIVVKCFLDCKFSRIEWHSTFCTI